MHVKLSFDRHWSDDIGLGFFESQPFFFVIGAFIIFYFFPFYNINPFIYPFKIFPLFISHQPQLLFQNFHLILSLHPTSKLL